MTLMYWTRSLTLLTACLLAGPLVQAQAEDEFEAVTTQALSPQDKEAARNKLREPVPPGLSNNQLQAFFQERMVLTERVDDLALSEQFFQSWMQALPSDPQPYWHLAGNMARTGRLAEFFPLAAKAATLAVNPATRASYLAETAQKYLQFQSDITQANGSLAQAEAALTQFRNLIGSRRGPGPQYNLARAEARVYSVKANVQAFGSQYDLADQSAAKATAAARRSLELGTQIDARRAFFARNELVTALTRQASVQNQRGALFDADLSLKQGLETIAAGSVAANTTSQLFSTIGSLRAQQGRYREAEYWARKSAENMLKAGSGDTAAPVLAARVIEETALAGQGRWREAWEKFQAVDRSAANSEEAKRISINPLTRALVQLKLGQWARAEDNLSKSWAKQIEYFGPNHFTTALTEGLLAWAMAENGKKTEALAHFDTALANLMSPQGTSAGYEEQGLRKLARKSIAEAYLKVIGSDANAQALERGFAMAEWLSGSSVQQALSDAAARTNFTDPKLQDALRREQDIQRELDVLYRYMNQQSTEASARQTPQITQQMRQRLEELSLQRRQLNDQISKTFPQYEQMVRPRPPTVKDIAQRLRDDEVFVLCLSTSIGTYVWAIDRQHGVTGWHSELDEATVAKLVQRMRVTLDVADRGTQAPTFDYAAAVQLYDGLLKPLAGTLAGKAHLIVSTTGTLAQVPFAALVTAPYKGVPAQAPWLIKQMAISHVPGASAWVALKQLSAAKSAPQAFMGWGDPLFDARQMPGNLNSTRSAPVDPEQDFARNGLKYSQIPALPETRGEVEAIAEMLKADKQKDTFFGKDANRESVLRMSQNGQLAQRRVIVFATHGLVPGDLPNLRQPALAMAANDAAESDPLAPLLTLEDVLSLKLNADWVVLSACNTAAAEGRAEEALSGLARGFFYAGSRSLLVTHWSVESESASLLTTGTFAHHIANPAARRAESLREAMLKVMAQPQFSHPAFWSPYALVGEGGR
jgi:CHAT domain-containing protein